MLFDLIGSENDMVTAKEINGLVRKAADLLRRRELADSEMVCKKILLIDKDNYSALFYSGIIQRKMKRYDEGIIFFGRAISLQPNSPNSHFELGNLYYDSGQLNEAIGSYEMAVNLNNEFLHALNCLGICLQMIECYERAEIVLKRAVSIQPDYVYAWINLANLLVDEEKYSEAIDSFRHATKLKPVFFKAHVGLARVLKEEGDLCGAKLVLKNAFRNDHSLKICINNVAAIAQLGESFANEFFNSSCL